MRRWTANFLLLVMFVPAFAPLALAGSAPAAMHCLRRPLREITTPAPPPAMHCHHSMAQPPPQQSEPASLRSLDCCCQNHACCHAVKTSEWAQPASIHLSVVSLRVEAAHAALTVIRPSADVTAPDSARAPPLH